MSKTLVSILEVAAIVGVQFIPIPGVGQTLGAVLSSSLGVSAGLGSALAVLAVAGVETALNATVFAPNAPKAKIPQQPLRSPTPPRVSGYCMLRSAPNLIR